MLKKSIFTVLFWLALTLTVVHVNAQQANPKEIELANLISAADTSLDLNEAETAEHYLFQAREIIFQNPEINEALQGHFNKVSGKLYMKSSFNQALEYFNTALMQFESDPSEQMRVNFFIGIAYYHTNDLDTAKIYFNEAKEYFIWSEDDLNLAQALNNLGVIAFDQKDEAAAVYFCRQALLINIEINASFNASRNRFNLDYFSDLSSRSIENEYNSTTIELGGGGGSGSGTTVNTGGSGTIVVGGNGGFTGN